MNDGYGLVLTRRLAHPEENKIVVNDDLIIELIKTDNPNRVKIRFQETGKRVYTIKRFESLISKDEQTA